MANIAQHVALLDDPARHRRALAARTLQELFGEEDIANDTALHRRNRDEGARAGAVAALLLHISSGSLQCRCWIASAVAKLTRDGDSRAAIVQHDGIRLLLDALCEPPAPCADRCRGWPNHFNTQA